jgi:branched-chain amino acid transport system permease protein
MSAFLEYLLTGLGIGCTFALIGSGFVMIYRVTRVVNFAQGTFVVLGGFCAYSFLRAGIPQGISELVAILAAGAAGAVVGMIALGRFGRPLIASLTITLGISIFAYALEIVVWGSQPLSFAGVGGYFHLLGAGIQNQYLVVIAVTIVVFVGLFAFLDKTYLGKGLSACASNPRAARIVGIDVIKLGIVAFAIGGLLGGLAGILITPIQPPSFDSDVAFAVNGFAASIFGGILSPWWTLAGGLLLGITEAMIGGYVSGSYENEVALIAILGILILRAWRSDLAALEQ